MKDTEKLIYLASPYSKYPEGRQKAFEEVCAKTAELMQIGYKVFSPIAHSHPIEQYGKIPSSVGTHDFWLRQDFAILDMSDELWVYKMPGWEDSYGVNAEIERAKDLDIPVKYISYHGGYVKAITEVVRGWIGATG